MFREIGNKIGAFLYADMNFLYPGIMVVERILVGLYLCDGLVIEMIV